MQINNNLQTVVPGPSNGLLKERHLTLDEWLASGYVESPVSDGDANMVQSVREKLGKIEYHEHVMDPPCSSDLREIRFSDPSVPVVLEFGCCGTPILELTERVFVDDIGVSGAIKEAWRNPRLMRKKTRKSLP